MNINNTQFSCTCEEVLSDLRQQLHENNIRLLEKEPKPSGDNIQIQCPYHKGGQERRLSAGVKKDTGVFHCFGCGETHSLPEVISYCFGHTDDVMGSYGWQWLVRNYLSISVEERKDVKLDYLRGTSGRSPVHFSHDADSNSDFDSHSDINNQKYISEDELDSYRYTHPYMYQRRLTDEIIDIFDIGYDRNSNCITFPIRDIRGRTLFVARRSVDSKFFNYPKGVEKPLYGLYELAHIKNGEPWYPAEVFICESMLDALTIWTYDKYALAMNGLGNEQQFEQMKKLPCRVLILATDNDEAGHKARYIIKHKVTNKLIKELILPRGKKDVNELSREEFEKCEIIL